MILTGAGTGKSTFKENDEQLPAAPKRARTSEDFYLFCKYILEYENYEEKKEEPEEPDKKKVKHCKKSHLSESGDGGSSSVHSFPTEVANECTIGQSVDTMLGLTTDSADEQTDHNSRLSKTTGSSTCSDDEEASSASTQDWMQKGIQFPDKKAYGEVTCFCKRPYAGRPMIECTKCLTWMHLSCAKVKKSNIPQNFFCSKCKKIMKNKNSLNNQPSRTGLPKQMKKKSGDDNNCKQ